MFQDIIEAYADKLSQNIPDLISVALVSTENTQVLAYRTSNGSDNRQTSSYQIEIFKNAIRSFENTEGMQDRNVTNVTIIYQGQIHLSSISANKKILVHLILKETANLPLIRVIAEKINTEMLAQYPLMSSL